MRLLKFSFLLFLATTLQSCYEDEIAGFDYQVGDVIPMVPNFNSNTDSVVFYWDDIKIGVEKVPPFVHYFSITDAVSSGSHSYTIKRYATNDNITYSSSTKSVTIK